MAPCQNASQAVTSRPSLPYQRKALTEAHPRDTAHYLTEPKGNVRNRETTFSRYLTIPDWGSADLTTGSAYIQIRFDPEQAFWPVWTITWYIAQENRPKLFPKVTTQPSFPTCAVIPVWFRLSSSIAGSYPRTALMLPPCSLHTSDHYC